MRRLGDRRWLAWIGARLAPLDAKVLRATDGRFGMLTGTGISTCLLTTTGRKSGQPRTVTLVYGRSRDEILVVGSNFGQQTHPAWAHNLSADPHCQVVIDGEGTDMLARKVTDPDEREAAFETMYRIWPAYAAYRGRAGREIMIFALSPER